MNAPLDVSLLRDMAGSFPKDDRPPQSAVPWTDGLLGLAGLAFAWIVARVFVDSIIVASALILTGAALPMLAAELLRQPKRTKRRERHIVPWVLGMTILVTLTLAVHLQGNNLASLIAGLLVVLPALALRILLLERTSWFSGLPVDLVHWVTRSGPRPEGHALRLFFLKAFFIPIYALRLGATVALTRAIGVSSPGEVLILCVAFAYLVDLAFGVAGYLFASNAIFTSVKSTNPFPLAWGVCLLSYVLVNQYWPAFAEVAHTEVLWPRIAAESGSPAVVVGTILLLAMAAIYIPATVVFGLRFSNLTNRGIVTTGPYRWLKHPAYTAHIVNSWVVVLIFAPAAGMVLSPSILLVPVAFTVLYTLRMRTEEQHLRADPAYVAYEAWIARNGFLARLGRALPGGRKLRPQ